MDEKMNLTIVYIDDDEKMQEDAFLDDINDQVNEILYFENRLKDWRMLRRISTRILSSF